MKCRICGKDGTIAFRPGRLVRMEYCNEHIVVDGVLRKEIVNGDVAEEEVTKEG